MKQKVDIRLMSLDDFKKLYALWKEADVSVVKKKIEFYEFNECLRINPTTCFVAIVGHIIIGSSLGLYNGRRAFITHLAISPSWQHQGIGSMLLKTTEKALMSVGAHAIRLYVSYDNIKVIPFYHASGYTSKQDSLLLGKTVPSIV